MPMPRTTDHISRRAGSGVNAAIAVAASDPSQRLELASEIAHESPVRRSGYIGDKLYSIAGRSVKAVDVASPSIVIGSVDVLEPNTMSGTTVCAFAVATAFTERSSNTASTTRSQPASAE